jgi:hypothetical protein
MYLYTPLNKFRQSNCHSQGAFIKESQASTASKYTTVGFTIEALTQRVDWMSVFVSRLSCYVTFSFKQTYYTALLIFTRSSSKIHKMKAYSSLKLLYNFGSI